MPKFTLIKEKDNSFDTEVKMTFEVDSATVAREYFDDFLRASGFVLPDYEGDDGTGFMVAGGLEWDSNGELVKPNRLKAIK